MIQDPPSVCLELDSRPECLTLVRAALAGAGERLAFDAELLDDLKTAVSEACNNVVLHAYGGEPGPLILGLGVRDEAVEVMVCDRGVGIQHITPSEERMGVGLAVISALADRAEFLTRPEGGTEVRMSFSAPRGTIEVPDTPGSVPGGAKPVDLSGDVVVTLAPIGLLAGVLGRVVRVLAARSRFSLDRFSDLYLVTDAIAAHAENAASSVGLSFAIVSTSRRLELTVGPFLPGSGAQLDESASPTRSRSPLAMLADELTIEPAGDQEMLHLVLIDHRGGADGPLD